MPSIYRKTAQGTAEIETRARRLTPRLRGMLIMVDGRRSDTELAALLPHAAEALATLAEQGFIERVAQAAPAAPAPAAARRAGTAAAAMPAPPARAPGPSAVADADFETRRRAVLRAFNDATGPAGETMAIKMERVTSLDDLRTLLPLAIRLVETVRGRAEAERFTARLDEI
jgi:hypothetical protein